MLKNTFCHIPGIGLKKEEALWSQGIDTWEKALNLQPGNGIITKIDDFKSSVNKSIKEYESRNTNLLSKNLASNLAWRIFPEYRDSIAYLDIETTGLDPHYSIITTIALYDGEAIHTYVNGENLDYFVQDIKKYKVIVTYNGKCFDIPFINHFFKIKLKHFHIDLRYVLYSLGYSGGLKGCEKSLGIDRGDLEGIDGLFAVYLWKEYKKRNNTKVLQTLLAYNIEDVINLEKLLVIAYNKKIKDTPFFEDLKLSDPIEPTTYYKPDKSILKKILKKYYGPIEPMDAANLWKDY